MNVKQMNTSSIVIEIHCHITGICDSPVSSSLFSAIVLYNFQSIAIPAPDHDKSPKFVHNSHD